MHLEHAQHVPAIGLKCGEEGWRGWGEEREGVGEAVSQSEKVNEKEAVREREVEWEREGERKEGIRKRKRGSEGG